MQLHYLSALEHFWEVTLIWIDGSNIIRKRNTCKVAFGESTNFPFIMTYEHPDTYSWCTYDPCGQLTAPRSLTCFVNQTHRLTQKYQVDLDYCRKVSSIGIEIHLIVSDHPVGVLVKTSKSAQGAQLATPIISATGTKKVIRQLKLFVGSVTYPSVRATTPIWGTSIAKVLHSLKT